MVSYNCIRCGYTTNDKTKMKTHFSRKTSCKPFLLDIQIELYKNDILNCKKIILLEETTKKQPKKFQIQPKTTKSQKPVNLNTSSTQQPQCEIPINQEISCKYCEKKFSFSQSLYRHYKTCKDKKNDEEDKNNLLNLINKLNEQLNEHREQLNEQINEQKEQINQIKKEQKEQLDKKDKQIDKKDKQIDELIKKAGITQNTQNIQNIQQNIKILAYKNTDISHLTDKDYMYCLNRSNMCIPNLIKKIHFDPKRPENHNIYISNIKNKYVMIYDGNKWILHNQDETIDDLIDTNEFVLEQKLEEWLENGKDYPDIMKKFNRYLAKKEKDDIINKIKEEIKLILFNDRIIIKNPINI
jgi:hypothetical protein